MANGTTGKFIGQVAAIALAGFIAALGGTVAGVEVVKYRISDVVVRMDKMESNFEKRLAVLENAQKAILTSQVEVLTQQLREASK